MKPISMNFLENSSKFSLAFEIKKKVKSTQSRSTVTRESTFQTHAFSGLYVKINVGFHSTEGKPIANVGNTSDTGSWFLFNLSLSYFIQF